MSSNPRSIAGVTFDSAGRFRTSPLLHTTCMHSCCNWVASCVAAYQTKTKPKQTWSRSAFEPGASGLPYYCTSICVRSWCKWRASCVDAKAGCSQVATLVSCPSCSSGFFEKHTVFTSYWSNCGCDSCDWRDWGLTLEALPQRGGGSAGCPKKTRGEWDTGVTIRHRLSSSHMRKTVSVSSTSLERVPFLRDFLVVLCSKQNKKGLLPQGA